MNKNKTSPNESVGRASQYVQYAIGEIVLVVVGILLALQINNWNEDHKRQRLKHNYLLSLLEDLRQDSIMVANQLEFYNQDTTQLNEQLRRIKQYPSRDTLVKIARYEMNTNVQIITDFNNKTYNSLINTGDIDLFESLLIEDLSRLDQFQKLAVSVYELSMDSYSDNLLNYRQHLTVFDDALAGDLLDPLWDQLSYEEIILQVNLIMTAKKTTATNVLQFLPVYLDYSSRLGTAIKQEYDLKGLEGVTDP